MLAVALLAGCQPSKRPNGLQKANGEPATAGADSITWPFWPRFVRIHPLTRFTTDRETGRLLIEARLEFLDSEEHTTKGFGQVRFDLHSASQRGDSRSLENWNEDLRDLTVNLTHFDDVTRTYLFRLQVDEALLPKRAMLKVRFLSADGETTQADFRLPSQ